jgi:hypothetical protein
MNNETIKHRNCLIQDTPTEKFPEMVTIIKTPKVKDIFHERKYITRSKAIIAIDEWEAEGLIMRGGKKVVEELIELGMDEEEAILSVDEE